MAWGVLDSWYNVIYWLGTGIGKTCDQSQYCQGLIMERADNNLNFSGNMS